MITPPDMPGLVKQTTVADKTARLGGTATRPFGAEIVGLDLTDGATEEQYRQIRDIVTEVHHLTRPKVGAKV
jgi:hypothetical protein